MPPIPPDPGVPPVTPPPFLGNQPGAVGSMSIPNINQGSFSYPNYNELLQQWLAPYLQQYQGNLAAQQAAAQTNIALARQRYQGGDTSTIARLGDIHNIALRDITNTLAARGILRSGETPYQTSQENLRYKRARTDAENQLLDYIRGIQQALADYQQQGQMSLAQQQMSLAQTIGGLYQPTWNPPGTSSAIQWAQQNILPYQGA